MKTIVDRSLWFLLGLLSGLVFMQWGLPRHPELCGPLSTGTWTIRCP